MSLVSTKGFFCLPDPFTSPAQGSASNLIDASGERTGSIFTVFKAGNIAAIYFRTGTVTLVDPIRVSIQGVSSSGVPDGTILGAGNAGYVDVTLETTNDSVWNGPYTLGAVVPVIQGQFISVVIEYPTYTNGNLNIVISGAVATGSSGIQNMVYLVTDVTASPGTWAKGSQGRQLCVAFEYDDGTYGYSNIGAGYFSLVTVNTGTSPDEIGNYLKLAMPFRAVGIWVYGDFDYDMTFSLLASDGTVLANCTLQAAFRGITTVGFFYVYFDSVPAASVNIARETYYRIVASPVGADSDIVNIFDAPVAAAMDAFDLGTDCVYTSRVDGGAWSQTATKRCMIGLIGDQLDDATYPTAAQVIDGTTFNGTTGNVVLPATTDVKNTVQYGPNHTDLTGTYAGGGGGGRPEIRGGNL